MNNWENLYIQM